MSYLTITFPCECDQAMMEIIFSHNLDPTAIRGHDICRETMEALFLSDITKADGKYLEHFIFNLGGNTKQSCYNFPQEQPTKQDWDGWMNFLHASQPQGETSRHHWANKQIQPTKYGCGTTIKRATSYITSVETQSSTLDEQLGGNTQDQ
jgi:hypothetical protein